MQKLSRRVKGAMSYFRRKYKLSYREGKPTVYKIQVIRNNVIGKEQIVPYAAKAAHVPETDVELAMNAMFDAIDYFCANGHRVEVPGLGSFGVQTNTKVARSLEECNTDTIKMRKVMFWPVGDLKTLGADVSFKENLTMTKQACPEEFPDEDEGGDDDGD